MDVEAVVSRAREQVDPDLEERDRLERVASELLERAREALAELPVEADAVRVGSTARDTWVAGDRDVDLFVRFPPELSRERLEEYGLRVGHSVLPDGREEYAEHPYVTGEFESFDVDCVPCYAVTSATEARSSVDRTPFHTEYLRGRLDGESAAEVRLAKGFLKGVGVYGSDLRTRGVSGYLTELLVLEYGGFRGLLEAARDWVPPVQLDPAGHAAAGFDDPLVVVDPTDPERNVAAVVSERNVARLIHHARAFLEEPSVEAFEPREPAALTPEAVREQLRRRGTRAVAVRFEAPNVVADQLFPQLERSLSGVRDALARRGFSPLRATVAAEPGDRRDQWGDAALLVECGVARLPGIERHEGPPVHVEGHGEAFYRAYADDPGSYGPFVENDRYVVERPRELTTPEAFLESDALLEVGHGARVADSLRSGYEVLVGEEVATLADSDPFGRALARYFDPQP
jgi:tRNA nucleotidyltransferase (CCA-adding enzyme)